MDKMEYKGYIAEIGIDQENGIFYGNVFGVRDVISFNGKTTAQLTKNFEDAIDNYLEYCTEEGIDPEKPYSGRFNVRLTPNMHKKAAKAAFKENISLNDLVRKALETEIAHKENSRVSA